MTDLDKILTFEGITSLLYPPCEYCGSHTCPGGRRCPVEERDIKDGKEKAKIRKFRGDYYEASNKRLETERD